MCTGVQLDFHIRRCSCGLTETRRVEQKLLILPVHMSSLPVFLSGVLVFLSLLFHVMFYRSLFVLWCFFFWPLCCPSFFNLRFLISPLVSSNPLFLVSSTEIRIGTTSFGISNQLRDNIYVICRCCLIVATYIYGKLTMGKFKSSLLS